MVIEDSEILRLAWSKADISCSFATPTSMFMINWHTIAEKLRQHRRGCAILVLFFSVFLVSLIWIRPSRISHANYERIRKGMTVDQVTKLLGPCSDKTFGRWPPGPNWFSSITW